MELTESALLDKSLKEAREPVDKVRQANKAAQKEQLALSSTQYPPLKPLKTEY